MILEIRYFLNVDRCAYGGLQEYADNSLGWKRVAGPTVFAVGPLCNFVYYYDEQPSGGWVMYNSARWDWLRRVHCDPEPREVRIFHEKYAECEEGKRSTEREAIVNEPSPSGKVKDYFLNVLKILISDNQWRI